MMLSIARIHQPCCHHPRHENVRLKRRVETKNKGNEKETHENVVFVHKIPSHQHKINKNEGESGYKIGGATNAPLTT